MLKLQELLDEIADSAAYTAHQAVVRSFEYYLTHFDSQEDEGLLIHTPKTHGVRLQEETPHIEVPEPSLIGPRVACLDRLKIEAETDLGEDQEGKGLLAGLTRGLHKKQTHIKIEAEFSTMPAAEGIQIIQERFHVKTRDGLKPTRENPQKEE